MLEGIVGLNPSAVPVFTMALADVIVYIEPAYHLIQFRYGLIDFLEFDSSKFSRTLQDETFLDQILARQPYPAGVARHVGHSPSEDGAGEEQEWLVVRVVAGPGQAVDVPRGDLGVGEIPQLLPGSGESGSDDLVGETLPAEDLDRGSEDLVLDDVVVVELVQAGAVPVVGFSLRLYDVFEKFVRSVLRESLAATSTDFPDNPADHQLFLDQDRRIRLLPDLSYRADGAWRFVGDVKYKTDTGNGLNPDLYQLLAYATATQLPAATLVYAHGPSTARSHTVSYRGTLLHVRHLVGTTETDESIRPDLARLERQQCLVHATAVNLLHGIGEKIVQQV